MVARARARRGAAAAEAPKRARAGWAYYGPQGEETRIVCRRNSGSEIRKLQSISWGGHAEAEISLARPPAPRDAPTVACSASAPRRTTWSDFWKPLTPTTHGEVLSVSFPGARNMPNAASDIVRPSFNTLNYHLSEPRIMNGSFCVWLDLRSTPPGS